MRSYVLLVVLFLAHQLSAQHTLHDSNEILNRLVEDGQVAGVVAAVIQNDEIIWTNAAGVRGQDEMLTTQTVLRVASIAKPMTAVAIMQLVERGRLDLDAPLTDYMPDYPQWGEITARQLLSHSSGIGDYSSKKEAENTIRYKSIEDAVKTFSDRELESVPGENFAYTTYGYVVLGLLIEKISGLTYSNYMRANIFEEAGMQHTYTVNNSSDDLITSDLYINKGKGKIRNVKSTDLSDRIPGGGIMSTAGDIMLFADAVMGNDLISGESLNEMVANSGVKTEGNPYGMGWYLYGDNPRLGNTIGHTGSQAGCSAILFVFPEQDAAVVVISNTSNAMQVVTETAIALFAMIEE